MPPCCTSRCTPGSTCRVPTRASHPHRTRWPDMKRCRTDRPSPQSPENRRSAHLQLQLPSSHLARRKWCRRAPRRPRSSWHRSRWNFHQLPRPRWFLRAHRSRARRRSRARTTPRCFVSKMAGSFRRLELGSSAPNGGELQLSLPSGSPVPVSRSAALSRSAAMGGRGLARRPILTTRRSTP